MCAHCHIGSPGCKQTRRSSDLHPHHRWSWGHYPIPDSTKMHSREQIEDFVVEKGYWRLMFIKRGSSLMFIGVKTCTRKQSICMGYGVN